MQEMELSPFPDYDSETPFVRNKPRRCQCPCATKSLAECGMKALTLAAMLLMSLFGAYYLNKGEISSLHNQIDAVDNQVPHLLAEVKTLQGGIADVQGTVGALAPQIDQLRRDLASLSIDAVAADVAALKLATAAAVAAAADALAAARAELADLRRANETLLHAAAAAREEIAHTAAALDATAARVAADTAAALAAAAARLHDVERRVNATVARAADTTAAAISRQDARQDAAIARQDARISAVISAAAAADAALNTTLVGLVRRAARPLAFMAAAATFNQNVSADTPITCNAPVSVGGRGATITWDAPGAAVRIETADDPATFALSAVLGIECQAGGESRFRFGWRVAGGAVPAVDGTTYGHTIPAVGHLPLPPRTVRKLQLLPTSSPNPACEARVTGSIVVEEL